MINKELQKRILSSIILIPTAIFFIFQEVIFFIFFLSLLFFFTSYEWFKMSKKNNFMRYVGIIFLIFSFYSAFYIRENSDNLFFLFVILICVSTDIGGYIFGKLFKGPKLTKISPKKTYSGVIGSFLLSLVVGLSFFKIIGSSYLETNSLKVFYGILIISLISQIGDLIISFFKRKVNIKDTGNILPGHGGILDRVDGIIFVMPIVYLKMFFI